MRIRVLATAIAGTALVLSACGDDDDAEPPEPTETVTVTEEPGDATGTPEPGDDETPAPGETETSPASPPATSPPSATWPTDDVSATFSGSVPPVPTLVDLRVGSHPADGYDRVALEFEGAAPGYEIGYRDDIVYDGSGEPVDLDGDAFIQLVFNPAQAHDDEGNSTLTNPPVEPVEADFPALASYVLNGDFEGYVSVALGLDDTAGFRVDQFRTDDGNHVIYIDVAIR